MTTRPSLAVLWAQDALPDNIGDADTYVPANPAYPEQKPNQYSAGWSVTGKKVVKQPHQWINSWYQSVDWRLMEWYARNFAWQPEITYAAGAVITVSNLRYVALSANTNKPPATNPAIWARAKFTTLAEATADYLSVAAKVNGHVENKNNPHGVTYVHLQGKSKAQIDAAVGTLKDPLEAHIANKNNPHELKPAQVNVLDKAVGGEFTGQVSMLRLEIGDSGIRRLSNGFEMHTPGARLGIDTTANDAQKDGEPVLTEANHADFRARSSSKFSVPIPDLHLPLNAHLNSYDSPKSGTVEYLSSTSIPYTTKSGLAMSAPPNIPGFGVNGLTLKSGTGQSLTATGLPSVLGDVTAVVDGVPKRATGALNKTNLLEYFSGNAIRDIRVWGVALTPEQLSSLGVNQ